MFFAMQVTVTNLVVVGLCHLRVLEEVVGAEEEVELESRLRVFSVGQSNVVECLEGLEISDCGVLQSSKPELGDTGNVGVLLVVLDLGQLGSLLLLVIVLLLLVVRVGSLAGLDILIRRLGFTSDDSLSSFVQGSVLAEELGGQCQNSRLICLSARLTFFSRSRMASWNSDSIFECSA
jgi:hypothetical protein